MRHALFSAYVVLDIAALTWPGYELWGNRIEPFILGIPFSMMWVVLWIVLTFVALWVYHLTAPDSERSSLGVERPRQAEGQGS